MRIFFKDIIDSDNNRSSEQKNRYLTVKNSIFTGASGYGWMDTQ